MAHLAATESEPDEELPVIVHLGYGVHGNETSSAEAAMLTAYWLVAGTGADVARYLEEGVYHVEPVLNPDGRDRHTNWADMHRSEPFVTDPLDREHNEVWPGGRTNHCSSGFQPSRAMTSCRRAAGASFCDGSTEVGAASTRPPVERVATRTSPA